MVPDTCPREGALTEGFSLVETDVVTGTALTTRKVATADLRAAASDLRGHGGSFAGPPSPPWGNLSAVGVAGRTVVLRTARFLVSVNADTGAVRGIDLAPDDRSGGTVPAYFGVVDGSVLAIQGDVIARVNLDTSTLDTLGSTGVSGDVMSVVTFGPDAAWTWTLPQPNMGPPPATDGPSKVVRIDGDGSVHPLDRFAGSILPGPGGPYPGPGLLWALTVDPGVDWSAVISGTDTQHELRLVGVDRDDGRTVATRTVPQEPSTGLLAYGFRDGFLSVTGSGLWRWVDNGGNLITLAHPPDFTPIAAAGDRLVGRTPANLITSIAVTDLIASG